MTDCGKREALGSATSRRMTMNGPRSTTWKGRITGFCASRRMTWKGRALFVILCEAQKPEARNACALLVILREAQKPEARNGGVRDV